MLWTILILFLIVGYIYPIVGLIAIVCMIAPVWMSLYRGRYWCGHFCPRGNYYDKVIARISLNKKIPAFLRHRYFRIFMVFFIFAMFGIQMFYAWGDWSAMGKVFWNIIFITTVVATLLGILYSPRAWCTFCPMGTLSAWVAPRKSKSSFKNIHVDDSCVSCKKCAKVCPMQLEPYRAKGENSGLLDPDCIKCGKCVTACRLKSIKMKAL